LWSLRWLVILSPLLRIYPHPTRVPLVTLLGCAYLL
jgi:hypothetical protein